LSASTFTAVAFYLSVNESHLIYAVSQVLLALSLLQWIIILHEAGHETLFRSRIANLLSGHIAGTFALLPYHSWKIVHQRHHVWIGWQDKDSTTADLVPRKLKLFEKLAINFAWRSYFPLFSIVYRIKNYWYLPRMLGYIEKENHSTAIFSVLFFLVFYIFLIYITGVNLIATSFLPGVFISFAIQDPIILSQHTHIPQKLARNQTVKPFPHSEQGQFSRSLILPNWFSFLILHFDYHERHHLHPNVPGYYLHKLDVEQPNAVHWLTWLRGAKKLKGEVFLFRNQHDTGFNL